MDNAVMLTCHLAGGAGTRRPATTRRCAEPATPGAIIHPFGLNPPVAVAAEGACMQVFKG
jgi:hypothetical protein